MKYALFILFSLLSAAHALASEDTRTIHSFRQSEAISAVAQFMYDVAEDIPVGARLSDKKVKITDFSKCTKVDASEVLDHVEKTIKRVLRVYPDEEIPFDQALIDFEDYLDHQTYRKCIFERKSSQTLTKTTYYASLDDKIHLRVDTIALSAE